MTLPILSPPPPSTRQGGSLSQLSLQQKYTIVEIQKYAFRVIESLEYLNFFFKEVGLDAHIDISELKHRAKNIERDDQFRKNMTAAMDQRAVIMTAPAAATLATILRTFIEKVLSLDLLNVENL